MGESHVEEIRRIHRPGRPEFFRECFRPGKPVLITGLLNDWPAMGKWTPEFFERIGGHKRVRIEYGNVLQDQPRFSEWELGTYLKRIQGESASPDQNRGESGSRKGKPIPASGAPVLLEEAVPYLAYFDIFKFFPELVKDVDFSFWKGRIRIPIGWIGPAGSYTGLHYDIAPNLFAQFHGAKEFTFYPPEQSRYLYPGSKYDIGSVLSDVDSRRPDPERFPEFRKARGVKVVVEAGDMLFTPRGWWHEVLGLDVSISVSCFGFGVADTLLRGLPGGFMHGLHKLGLYRKGNCACHMR
jgi:hypothetical protein